MSRNRKNYIFYEQAHTGIQKRLICGDGLFMRWDCVRFFIEDRLGLHRNMASTTAYVVGRYIEEENSWFDDMDMITGQRTVYVQVVPYWTQFDYDGINTRSAPQRGPVYVPGPIKSYLGNWAS